MLVGSKCLLILGIPRLDGYRRGRWWEMNRRARLDTVERSGNNNSVADKPNLADTRFVPRETEHT